MAGLLRRLLASSAAYQAASVVSSLLALVTIRLYTAHLTDAQLGYAETLLTAIILASILLRFGIGEAFVRFWFDDEDPERRRALARTATAFTLYTSTAVALLGLAGILPMTYTTSNNVEIAGLTTSWIVPVAILALMSTAVAYVLGIRAVALLRPSFASLVGLAEVLFAVLWAWLLVGEAMTATQAIGGAVVLAGLALARLGDRPAPESAVETAATLPDIDQNNATTR